MADCSSSRGISLKNPYNKKTAKETLKYRYNTISTVRVSNMPKPLKSMKKGMAATAAGNIRVEIVTKSRWP